MQTSFDEPAPMVNPFTQWYWWFAWYPTWVGGRLVWLKGVERRIVYQRAWEGEYEYR